MYTQKISDALEVLFIIAPRSEYFLKMRYSTNARHLLRLTCNYRLKFRFFKIIAEYFTTHCFSCVATLKRKKSVNF